MTGIPQFNQNPGAAQPTEADDPFKYASPSFDFGPQTAQASADDIFGSMAEVGQADSQEARGVWENIKWQGAATAKTIGDSFVNVASLLHKTGGGVVGLVQGEGFGSGWENVRQHYKNLYGTTDPSIMDLGAGFGYYGDSGLYKSVGEKADVEISKRLGRSEMFGRAVGGVVSFAVPGGPIGKASTVASKPIGRVAERILETAALKAANVGDDAARALIESGRGLEFLARNPGMNTALSTTLATAGRTAAQMATTTGAFVSQAYAISPDSERAKAAQHAAMIAPFMLPIAQLGESLGQTVSQLGLSPQKMQQLRTSYQSFESGQISYNALTNQISRTMGMPRRMAANMVAAPFESSAFMAMDPNAWDLLQKGLGGDADAWADLQMMWLGTTAGITATKGLVPHDSAAFWKSFRPDANKLETYLQADQNRRIAETIRADREQARETENVLREGEQLEADREIARTEAQEQQAAQARAETQARTEQFQMGRGGLQDPIARQYAWADGPTRAALRGAWEPSFRATEEPGVVYLTFNGENTVRLSQRGDGVELQLNDATMNLLEGINRGVKDAPGYERIGPDASVLRGPQARQTLDDLALIGGLRVMQGERNFSRLGYTEIAPGLWRNPQTDAQYRVRLNGEVQVRQSLDAPWTNADATHTFGEAPVVWDNAAANAIGEWLMAKQQLSPNRLVDTIFGEALTLAREGTGRSADQMRSMFEALDADPAALRDFMDRLNPQEDGLIALELASLGSGTENAGNVLGRLQSDTMMRRAAEMEAGSEQQAEFLRNLEGEGAPRLTDEQRIRLNQLTEQSKQAKREQSNAEYEAALREGAEAQQPQPPAEPPAPEPIPSAGEEMLRLGGERMQQLREMVRQRRERRAQELERQPEREREQYRRMMEEAAAAERRDMRRTRSPEEIETWAVESQRRRQEDQLAQENLSEAEAQRLRDEMQRGEEIEAETQIRESERLQDEQRRETALREAKTQEEVAAIEARLAAQKQNLEKRYTRQDEMREAIASSVSRTQMTGTVRQKISAERAAGLVRFTKAGSNLRKQLNRAIESNGVVEIEIGSSDFQDLAQAYGRFAGRQASLREGDPEVAFRRLQSTDDFVRAVAEAFGAQIPGRSVAETFAARLKAQEDLARRVSGAGSETMSAQRVAGPQRANLPAESERLGVPDVGREGQGGWTRRTGEAAGGQRDIELMRVEEVLREELAREEEMARAEQEQPPVEVQQPTQAEAAPAEPAAAQPAPEAAPARKKPARQRPSREQDRLLDLVQIAQQRMAQASAKARKAQLELTAALDREAPNSEIQLLRKKLEVRKQLAEEADAQFREANRNAWAAKKSQEGGFVDIGAAFDAINRGVDRVIAAARRVADTARTGNLGLAARQVLRTQNQMARSVLSQIDPTLADRMRRSRTGIAPRLAGEAKARLRPARDALRQLESDWSANRSPIDRLMGRNRWQDQMVNIGNNMERARWEQLVDGRIQPANALEQQFVDSMQSSLRYLYSEAAAAGKTRLEWDPIARELNVVPLRPRSSAVVPFQRGRDLDTILGSDQLRMDWFNDLAAANPQVLVSYRDSVTNQVRQRPIEGRDLEFEYQETLRARTTMEFGDSAEALSALDYTRRFTNMGHRWNGYEVRGNDVMPLMEQQIAKQSTGIAVATEFGEDHSAAARQRFIQDYANDPQAAAAIDMMTNRPGLNTLVADAVSRISNRGSESLNMLYRKAVQDYAARVAGKEPNAAGWLSDLATFGRIGRGVENVGRAVTIWKSFVLDIPEFVTQPMVYGTWRDLGRGLSMMMSRRPGMTRAESLREAVNLVKQEGLVEDFMGNHVFGESAEIGKRFAEMVSVPGSLSETGKQTLFAFNAKARLERWGRQESTQFDRDVLRDVMQYPEAEANALLSGQADAALRTQFQRDYVQLLSSRRGQGEGPALADNPTANRLLRYVRWATNRTANTVTAAKNVYDSRQALQANRTPETQRAYYSSLKRAARLTLGTAVAGNVGSMLAYAFADMMRGENGFSRWGREFMSSPVSTVLGNLGKQMIGGPIAQLATAAYKDEPERIVSLVPSINAAYSALSNVGDVSAAWASGDVTKAIRKTRDFAFSIAEDVGVIPRAEVRTLLSYWKGEVDQRNLDMRAREFERNEDIKRPMGNRYRPEEYYDAVKALVVSARDSDLSEDFLKQAADPRVRAAVQRGEAPPPESMTNYQALQEALAVAPGESVASSIEGHRRMRHWSNEQRAKFIDIHGDEAFRQMAQSDEALTELARAVRKYEGTAPTEWESELDSVARQASLGATDRWSQLIDRTIDESALRRDAGDGFGEQLDQLATEMSARPETLDRVFTDERMKRILARPLDSATLKRVILGQLRTRVVDRQKNRRREAAKERIK